MATAIDPKELTVSNFQAILLEALDRVCDQDAILYYDPHAEEECGDIVHEAGDLASYLGFADLHQRSVEIAPYCDSDEAGVHGYLCPPAEAQTFLSACLEKCKAVSPASCSVVGTADPRGTSDGRNRTGLNCYQRAYNWWYLAQHSKGASATDQACYDWAVKQAAEEGEKLPVFETWVRYVRKERTARGEQKHWHGRVAR